MNLKQCILAEEANVGHRLPELRHFHRMLSGGITPPTTPARRRPQGRLRTPPTREYPETVLEHMARVAQWRATHSTHYPSPSASESDSDSDSEPDVETPRTQPVTPRTQHEESEEVASPRTPRTQPTTPQLEESEEAESFHNPRKRTPPTVEYSGPVPKRSRQRQASLSPRRLF